VKTIFDCDIENGCRAIALSQDARYLATLTAAEEQVSGSFCFFFIIFQTLPYILAYKLQNLRQNHATKVRGATYPRVIK